MNEALFVLGMEYLVFVDLCYVFKMKNYWKETRPGYEPASRCSEDRCEFYHSFVPDLWPILLPTPLEYVYLEYQYRKHHGKK